MLPISFQASHLFVMGFLKLSTTQRGELRALLSARVCVCACAFAWCFLGVTLPCLSQCVDTARRHDTA